MNNKKIKVGDKVRVKSFKERPVYWNGQGEMEYLMGKIVTVEYVSRTGIRIKNQNGFGSWYLAFSDIEPLKKECIVIYRNDSEVIALDKTTGEKAVAKCSPVDEFDFKFGAKLAFERLLGGEVKEEKPKLYNGKIVCVSNYMNTNNLTVGKIYEIKDGFYLDDDGAKRPHDRKAIKNLEEYFSRTYAKFVELVE